MRVCVNWLPLSLAATSEVARAAESAGLWGIGIGDSPRYAELYSACEAALTATTSLTVTTCVTNPVTRHWSVHASAARGLLGAHPGRFRLGVGRGDSAVHTFGIEHAGLAELDSFLRSIRENSDVPLLLASSGPKTAQIGGRLADGVIAGVGRDPEDLRAVADVVGAATEGAPREIWATVRIAVTRDAAETAVMRRRLVPRAVSASHFAFGSTLSSKRVPPEFAEVLRERYRTYDYGSHGSSGATSNAGMFADHPEIEDYLLDRFAIVGTVEECRAQLGALSNHVDGVFLSLVFEDALEQIERIGIVLGN